MPVFAMVGKQERSNVATWLEFHDSTLAAVNHITTDVEVVLDAYVHRWDISGDTWRGTGWIQAVRILIRDVDVRAVAPMLPMHISDGRLRVGAVTHDNLVPLPFDASDATSLWLQLTNADIVEYLGRGGRIDAVGEARFVEVLPADLRPDRPV